MRTRKEHNEYCKSKGINPRICDETNKWMDEPAKKGGGCAHRKERHGFIDGLKWSFSANNPGEAISRYRAYQLHRKADRKTGRC